MLVLKSILILSTLASTLYWLVLFLKLSFYKEAISYANFTAPSILISAKNEAENLRNHLPSILNQAKLSNVVVMDDYSIDNTGKILQSIAAENKKLTHSIPTADLPGKKHALSEGIQLCVSDNILLTDADCYPNTENWASIMTHKINEGSRLILGYGPLKKTRGLLNTFARYETVLTAIQYFGYTLYNMPYMGVGRNLAFTKKLFDLTKGYSSHSHIASGDDDLYVQEASKHTNVQICLDPDSFVYSHSPENLKAYIRQKKRHIATSTNYTLKHKILLSIHPIFHLMAFGISVLLMVMGMYQLIISIWLVRWLLLMLFGFRPYSQLVSKDLIAWIPLLDILLVIYYLYFGWSAMNKKNASW